MSFNAWHNNQTEIHTTAFRDWLATKIGSNLLLERTITSSFHLLLDIENCITSQLKPIDWALNMEWKLIENGFTIDHKISEACNTIQYRILFLTLEPWCQSKTLYPSLEQILSLTFNAMMADSNSPAISREKKIWFNDTISIYLMLLEIKFWLILVNSKWTQNRHTHNQSTEKKAANVKFCIRVRNRKRRRKGEKEIHYADWMLVSNQHHTDWHVCRFLAIQFHLKYDLRASPKLTQQLL